MFWGGHGMDRRPARVGERVFVGEYIETGPDASVRVFFSGGSLLTLHGKTRFQIYFIREQKPGFFVYVFRLITGWLTPGRQSPKAAVVPATIGVRGSAYGYDY